MADHQDPVLSVRHDGTLTEDKLRALGAYDPNRGSQLEVAIGDGKILIGRNGLPVAELLALASLDDLDLTGLLDEGSLRYNGTSSKWELVFDDRVVAKSTIADSQTIANTVVETTFNRTLTVKAKVLGSSSQFRIVASGKIKRNGTDQMTLRMKLGATTLWTSEQFDAGSAADITWSVVLEGTMRSSSQLAIHQVQGSYGTTLLDPPVFGSSVSVSAASDQTLQLTAQWSAANANNQIVLYHLAYQVLQPNAQQA